MKTREKIHCWMERVLQEPFYQAEIMRAEPYNDKKKGAVAGVLFSIVIIYGILINWLFGSV